MDVLDATQINVSHSQLYSGSTVGIIHCDNNYKRRWRRHPTC